MSLAGHFVAQIRLIFRPKSGVQQHTLAYVQPFKPGAGGTKGHWLRHVADENIDMFRVRRLLDVDKSRSARLVKLTDIWRPIELIPLFGKRCPSHWNSWNSVELADEFYVNSFTDKETYNPDFDGILGNRCRIVASDFSDCIDRARTSTI